MTGLSGMKIFQEFTVDTNYLPSNYDREMTFLIKGVSHTIQNNTWDTTIESLSLPKITTKPDSISTLVNVNNAITTDTKANIIPLSKAGVVQDIIDYASSVGITDKEQLTAILTVAQAETNLTPTAIENKTYSINRAKQVYADRLIGKTDVEIRNIFSTSESAYNFAYNGVNGNQLVGDGYRFRGRGLTQITGRANYKKLTSVLKDNGVNLDLVNNPDLAARIDTSVKILILGKIKGLFGTSLNPKTKYTTSPTSILATQNRGALKNQTIINDYGRALAAINNTKWIQDLLNKS
jgi:putative chitinase